jgi:flagellar motility protein MotE (MotC chaperone)
MIRFVRDFRLIPVVLVATICLFALKTLGLWFDGGYTLANLIDRNAGDPADITGSVASSRQPGSPPAQAARLPARPQSWAQEMFNFPGAPGSAAADEPASPRGRDRSAPDVTGSIKPDAAKPAQPPAGKPVNPAAGQGWTPVPVDGGKPQSVAERALLERLHERRLELDERARALDMRESLIQAAEKRLEVRVNELKDLEARITSAVQQKQDADLARFKNLVTMYENMKAKDAARIFERLDTQVLIEVAAQINPRRMSEILAQMSPDAAQRLTVELASRASAKDKPASKELPKIEGRPSPPAAERNS